MRLYRKIFTIMALGSIATGSVLSEGITTRNVETGVSGDYFHLNADLVLDSLKLGGNRQMFVTPVISDGGTHRKELPSLLVNGRRMHISYQRGALKGFKEIKSHEIWNEVERRNGEPQNVSYSTRTPAESWMRSKNATVTFVYDSCGCGALYGSSISPEIPLFENPVKEMRTVMITPAVTELPVSIHEGKARVQFEVDKTELHPQPYVCKNGQRIDNRAQLSIIEDSIRYATSDPNVEIAKITITGYASPESPYEHNDYLATNRSRALAEYIADRFSLPRGIADYGSVPENWVEFRQQVVDSKELTDKQRADLLELIDRPAYGPADYDAKEKELKTSPKFAALYKSTILPKWFPQLRATKFAISTRLKPMPDEQLAEIILTSPEKMSLNQMFRVARLYDENSPEFRRTIETALKYYPDSEEANTNVAVWALNSGDYDRAAELLKRAGDNPEANNARGILATKAGDFQSAAKYFKAAGNLPEAKHNRAMLGLEK